MRKDQLVKTYGRHKSRVVVADVWLARGNKEPANVFGTSSELDGSKQSSVFHISSGSEHSSSLNSTGNSVDQPVLKNKHNSRNRTNRSTKTNKAVLNKENVSPFTEGRSTRNQKTHRQKKCTSIWSVTSSSDCSVESEKPIKSRALRDRNRKVEYNDSANLAKQLKGATAKRKRLPKVDNSVKATATTSVNFSDFDDYSLNIADASTDDRGQPLNNVTKCIETSTPVAKRTRCKETPLIERIGKSDLSHIEVIESPMSDVCYTSIDTNNSYGGNYESYASMMSSPSILPSNSSNPAKPSKPNTRASEKERLTTPNSHVELEKLTDSFIATHTGSGKSNNKMPSRMCSDVVNNLCYDNSGSLFSSPDRDFQKNISLISERLNKVSFIATNDLLDEEEESEESVEEESDADNVDDDDLSAINEDDEETSSEEEEEEEESDSDEEQDQSIDADTDSMQTSSAQVDDVDESDTEASEEDFDDSEEESDEVDENDSYTSDVLESSTDCASTSKPAANVRITRNMKQQLDSPENIKVNLQKLSESFMSNFVSGRRTSKRKTINDKHEDSKNREVSEVSECDTVDSSTSNCTLYMLNEDYVSQSECSGNSGAGSHDLFSTCGSHLPEESMSGSSCYNTASADSSRLKDDDDDNTCDDENDSNDDDDANDDENSGIQADENNSYVTPSKKVYSLRDKQLSEIQHSFSKMLTPTRRKGSLLPVSERTKVMVFCDQTEPVPFKTALPGNLPERRSLTRMLSQCVKIGEGVYGEVFRSFHNNQPVAIKIIPIEGDFSVNDEPQKKFEDIIAEIVIAKELSDLRNTKSCMTSNFCLVNSISCVKGKFPPELLKQWDLYHKKKGSENDRPDMFKDDQLFILFEFADCGKDLQSYEFTSLEQAKSTLAQVTLALAVAEEMLQFEHRDLHWGNVLIKPTDLEDIQYTVLGKRITVPSMGVQANIIDFTLSRLMKDGATVYTDLSTDDELFAGKGDYQFDTYRNMKKENGNNWEPFTPRTNVLWLHYVADKLVYSKHYPTKSGRQDRDMLRQFRQFLSQMLNYHSASEMAIDSDFLNS